MKRLIMLNIVWMIVLFNLLYVSADSCPASYLNTQLGSCFKLEEAGSPYVDEEGIANLVAGSAPTQAAGYINFGQTFTNDYLQMGDNYEAQDVTISMMYNGNPSGSEQIFSKYGGAGSRSLLYQFNADNTFQWYTYNDAGADNIQSNISVPDNTWAMVTSTYAFSGAYPVYHYLNDTKAGSGNTRQMDDNAQALELGSYGGGAGQFLTGTVDMIRIFNDDLNYTCIQKLWSRTQASEECVFTDGGGVIVATLDYPSNETHYTYNNPNTSKNYEGIINFTTNLDANCSLNDTRWDINTTDGTTHIFINNTAISYGNQSIFLSCNASGAVGYNTTLWFVIDTVSVTATLNIANNSIQLTPFNLTVDYYDQYLYRTNTSLYRDSDNKLLWNNYSGNLGYETEWWNTTFFVNTTNSSYPVGDTFTIRVNGVDTHTAAEFKEKPKVIETTVGSQKVKDYDLLYGDFRIYYPTELDIEELYSFDRMMFKLKTDILKDTKVKQYIEADKFWYYPESEYPCHFIINDKYWYDCDGLKEPKVKKVTDTIYEIEFYMDNNEVLTRSLGGLNQINTSYVFTVHMNMTGEVHVGDVFIPSDVNFSYTSGFDFNVTWLYVNNTCIVIFNSTNSSFDGEYCWNLSSLYLEDEILFWNATPLDCYMLASSDGDSFTTLFEWHNKTNESVKSGLNTCEHETLCTVDTLEGSYTRFNDSTECNINITHDWFWFVNHTTTVDTHSIGECDLYHNVTLINISYFDELTDVPINATNTYESVFFDGSGYFHLDGGFASNTSHYFCTDYEDATVNLLLFGQFVVSSPSYITRTFSIPETSGIVVSNNPYLNQSLYLITVSNSSTITYTWQTTDYQNIDGTMLVYRCEDDGSKTLIESTSISSGIAIVNLELYSTPYSYSVVIDNQTYSNSETYSSCHAESTTSRTYFVDVTDVDFLPVIGLYLIDCEMEKPTSNTAKMSWAANRNDNSDIEACIVGYREVITGKVEIYRSCVNQSSGTFTRTVPTTSNNYYVVGELTQNGYTGFCRDTLVFNNRGDASEASGMFGLLATGILILALALLYAGDNTKTLVGAGLGVIIAWLIGITSINGTIVTSIVVFLVAIALIARAWRVSQ